MKKLVLVLAIFALAAVAPAVAGCAKSEKADCPMMMKGVERSATNMDNGVVIMLTASDVEQVKTLQTKMAEKMESGCDCGCPVHGKNVKRTVENTDNGVKLTLTSDDKDQVKTLQTYASKNCSKEGCPHAKGAKA